MAPRTPSPNRSKKAEPYNPFTPLAEPFAQRSLLTPGGISIYARIESIAKRYPYPSRIPGPAFALGKRCWGCAEEIVIVQAEARGEGQGRQGCRCFALDLCFGCKLKELEMSAIRRDMTVERQMCVKGTKEAYEVMVGCFCGSDDVGGGLRCAGCEGVVCLFNKRDRMNEKFEPERNRTLRDKAVS